MKRISSTVVTKKTRPVNTPTVCANHTLRGSPTASDTERCCRVHHMNIPSDIRVRIAYQLRRIPRTALVDTVTCNRVISANHREIRPMNPPIPYAKSVDNHTLTATIAQILIYLNYFPFTRHYSLPLCDSGSSRLISVPSSFSRSLCLSASPGRPARH